MVVSVGGTQSLAELGGCPVGWGAALGLVCPHRGLGPVPVGLPQGTGRGQLSTAWGPSSCSARPAPPAALGAVSGLVPRGSSPASFDMPRLDHISVSSFIEILLMRGSRASPSKYISNWTVSRHSGTASRWRSLQPRLVPWSRQWPPDGSPAALCPPMPYSPHSSRSDLLKSQITSLSCSRTSHPIKNTTIFFPDACDVPPAGPPPLSPCHLRPPAGQAPPHPGLCTAVSSRTFFPCLFACLFTSPLVGFSSSATFPRGLPCPLPPHSFSS